jgi:hypothetical protein
MDNNIDVCLNELYAILDCGDTSCVFRKSAGVRTNGGCRCGDKPEVEQWAMRLLVYSIASADPLVREAAQKMLSTIAETSRVRSPFYSFRSLLRLAALIVAGAQSNHKESQQGLKTEPAIRS